MGWFSGFVSWLLVVAGSAMFAYSAWRLATSRESRLLRLGQMAFYAALMLIAVPKEQGDLSGDRPFWVAFALLLMSFGLTIAHKLRRKRQGPG